MRFKRILIFVGIILGLTLLSIFYPNIKQTNIEDYEKERCFVDRIIDGDTLVCDNETIRLLGIDTPEKGELYFEEARDYLKEVEGKEIEILRDWDDKGKYYRKLRYVFYEDRLINIEIVEKGLAFAFMTDDLVYEEKLLIAEEFARDNCLMIWKETC